MRRRAVTAERVNQIHKTTAALVREVRQFHDLDQEQFAARMRISRRTVIRWEQHGVYISRATWNPQSQAWSALLTPYLLSQVAPEVRAQLAASK